MTRHLTDLDELSQNVKNAHSRNYLDEAIKSYRAGAYRASLISTWIAVCVDIIEKIKELALTEDQAALTIAKRLDAIDPSNTTAMLAFERQILDFACEDLELISHIEKAHLERLKTDRNLCAHPTFSPDGTQFSPLPELSLAYIVQASNYLLIQIPVKGKVIIKRLYELIGEESFPEDDEKAWQVLSSDTNLGRVRESVSRNLTIVLIKRLFQDDEPIAPELLDRISASLGVISRIFPAIYKDVINGKLAEMLEQASDKKLKRFFPFLTKRTEVWSQITNPVKIRLDGLVHIMDVDEMINYRIPTLATKVAEIHTALQDSVNHLIVEDLRKLLNSTASAALKQHAISYFIDARSFDSAESRGNNVILPHAQYFTSEDLQRLFDGSYANSNWNINQILQAGGIGHFFSELYVKTKLNIQDHRERWLAFWKTVSDQGYRYPSLREKMESDQLIEAEEVEDDPGDIPF